MATIPYLTAGKRRMGRKREKGIYLHNKRIDREGKENVARLRQAESSLYPFDLRNYFERFGDKFLFDTFVKNITSIGNINERLNLVEEVAGTLPTAGDRLRSVLYWSRFCIDEVHKGEEPWGSRSYRQKIEFGVRILEFADIETKNANTKVARQFESANNVLLDKILPEATSEETLKPVLIKLYGDGKTTTGDYKVSTVAPSAKKVESATKKLGDFTITIATTEDLANSIIYDRGGSIFSCRADCGANRCQPHS